MKKLSKIKKNSKNKVVLYRGEGGGNQCCSGYQCCKG